MTTEREIQMMPKVFCLNSVHSHELPMELIFRNGKLFHACICGRNCRVELPNNRQKVTEYSQIIAFEAVRHALAFYLAGGEDWREKAVQDIQNLIEGQGESNEPINDQHVQTL